MLAANVSSFSNKLTKSLSSKFNKPSLAVSYSPLYFLEKVDSKLLPNIGAEFFNISFAVSTSICQYDLAKKFSSSITGLSVNCFLNLYCDSI